MLPRDATVKHALDLNIYFFPIYVIMFHMLQKVDQHEDIVQEIIIKRSRDGKASEWKQCTILIYYIICIICLYISYVLIPCIFFIQCVIWYRFSKFHWPLLINFLFFFSKNFDTQFSSFFWYCFSIQKAREINNIIESRAGENIINEIILIIDNILLFI